MDRVSRVACSRDPLFGQQVFPFTTGLEQSEIMLTHLCPDKMILDPSTRAVVFLRLVASDEATDISSLSLICKSRQ